MILIVLVSGMDTFSDALIFRREAGRVAAGGERPGKLGREETFSWYSWQTLLPEGTRCELCTLRLHLPFIEKCRAGRGIQGPRRLK